MRTTARTQQEIQIAAEEECALLAEEGYYKEACLRAATLIDCASHKEKMHHNMAWWGYKAGMFAEALVHAKAALSIRRDAQNLLNAAYIAFAQNEFMQCRRLSIEAIEDVEREFGISFENPALTSNTIIRSNTLVEHYVQEFTKLLMKSCIKAGETKDALAYLAIGKMLLPKHGYWEDIEDLWPNDHDEFDNLVIKHRDSLCLQYPNIPISAVRCIARAEAFYEFVKAPELWYSMICREYGVAFEIILRNVVCQGEQSMSLAELINYISGRPGDPLYGGYALLDTLRKIRNRNSHTAIDDAEDVERSRRILFEEVLAKL